NGLTEPHSLPACQGRLRFSLFTILHYSFHNSWNVLKQLFIDLPSNITMFFLSGYISSQLKIMNPRTDSARHIHARLRETFRQQSSSNFFSDASFQGFMIHRISITKHFSLSYSPFMVGFRIVNSNTVLPVFGVLQASFTILKSIFNFCISLTKLLEGKAT